MRGGLLVVGLLGCGGGGSEAPSGVVCDTAPVVTWDNFGQGFVTQHCQACHASTAHERYGAPDEVVFDTEPDAWTWSDRILVRAGSDPPTMPPQGGVEDDDRVLLRLWLTCDAPAGGG